MLNNAAQNCSTNHTCGTPVCRLLNSQHDSALTQAGPVHRDLRRSSGDVTSQSVIGIGTGGTYCDAHFRDWTPGGRGGAQLPGYQVGVGQGPPESGRGHQQPSGAKLMRLLRVVGRAVDELAGELVPRQPPVADELAQGVLGADTEPVVELVDEVSGVGVLDERLAVATRAPAGRSRRRGTPTGRVGRSRRARRAYSSRRDGSSWFGRRAPPNPPLDLARLRLLGNSPRFRP